jgi:septum formation protein
MPDEIILASASPFRAKMLDDAGIRFRAVAPDLDERAAEAPLAETGASPEDVAAVLAEAKAMAVAEANPNALVIGSDQTLSLGDRIFHKPADMEAARRHLLALSGQTHQLNTAADIVQGERTLWRHVEDARLTMRSQ